MTTKLAENRVLELKPGHVVKTIRLAPLDKWPTVCLGKLKRLYDKGDRYVRVNEVGSDGEHPHMHIWLEGPESRDTVAKTLTRMKEEYGIDKGNGTSSVKVIEEPDLHALQYLFKEKGLKVTRMPETDETDARHYAYRFSTLLSEGMLPEKVAELDELMGIIEDSMEQHDDWITATEQLVRLLADRTVQRGKQLQWWRLKQKALTLIYDKYTAKRHEMVRELCNLRR